MSTTRQVKCCTGLTVTVREMTGHEISALKQSRNADDDGAYLANQCLVNVDDTGPLYDWPTGQFVVDDLAAGDLAEILIGVRCATFGNEFTFALACPYCGDGHEYTIDLQRDLEHRPMDEEAIDRLLRKEPFQTEVQAGTKTHVVQWLPARRRQLLKARKQAKLNPERAYAWAVSTRVLEVSGVHENGKLAWLEDLGVGMLAKLVDLMDYYDGGINGDIELRCGSDACRKTFVATVPLDSEALWQRPKPRWAKQGRPDHRRIG